MKKYINTSKISSYKPLIVIIATLATASLAISLNKADESIMGNFMGLFFIVFAMFKFFNINAFVKGFRKYDLITQKYELYGYSYPFIELIIGLLYLSNGFPTLTNIITFIVMSASSYSVIKSIRSGLDIKCACLGTSLNVPLSTVSLIENLSMSLMSLYMIFRCFS